VDSIVAAGRMLGVEVVVIGLELNRDLERVFATMAEHRSSGGLIINSTADLIENGLIENGAQLVALAKRYDVPTIYPSALFVRQGGLVSYGTDVLATYRQVAAQFVGPILKGNKPADLPIQQPTKFEFVINLKLAKALGLAVPPSLRVLATELIE
jgi:putative ABC transport system substrate-binding protein